GASASSPAPTAASAPPARATRFTPKWRGRSSPRWCRVRGSRARGCGGDERRAPRSLAAAEPRTEKRDRARDRILGRLRVCRDALALRSWIVEAMGGAGIERDRDLAAARAACRDESLTALRRHFLVGRADEHRNARVRLVAALREGILQSKGRIERKRGGETLLRRGREACVRRHCGKRCAAAIRPALQADTCAVDLTARAQIRERAIG